MCELSLLVPFQSLIVWWKDYVNRHLYLLGYLKCQAVLISIKPILWDKVNGGNFGSKVNGGNFGSIV